LVKRESLVLVLAEQPQEHLLEVLTYLDLVKLIRQLLVLDEVVEVLVLALVCVLEAGVAEHQQLHDHA